MEEITSSEQKEVVAKPKRDHRLHASTAYTVLFSLAILAFLFTFSFTKAWGERVDRLAEQSTTDVFKSMDLETIDGEHFTSENLKDARITIFNIWGTDCAPCIKELPELQKLNESYAPGEIQVIGLLNDSVDDEIQPIQSHIDIAKQYMEKSSATYPTLILDAPTYAFVKTNIIGTPTTFIVDSDGNIIKTVTGSNNYESWKAYVDEALASLS